MDTQKARIFTPARFVALVVIAARQRLAEQARRDVGSGTVLVTASTLPVMV
jgi:hypothetical protein